MSNLIPVSRKEQYLSKIDGMTNKSPDKTYTKEEYFFSEILGEALHKPVLETRYEMYLAKIAGRGIGIPYPETRLERFLAKAAGMNISVPTPITREEMYWSTYSPFYLSNSSGTSPLTYGKCKIGTLSNYRIYGNTVNGESVGDRTGNLFDKTNFIQTNLVSYDGEDYILREDPYTISTIIPCNPNTKYTISKIVTNRFAIWGCTDYPTINKHCNRRIISGSDSSSLTFTTGNDDNYLLIMLFYKRQPTDPTIEDVKGSLMFNYGEALPYEPYGCRMPVTVTNGTDTETTSIYLPEPIKMVGDEAEYVDYAEQKQYIETTDGQEKYVVGLNVDFENKTFTRLADAIGLSKGTDFDIFSAFGGRRRCNVADNGSITAYYGDANYTEDGSNGQVMVYQPAFYYKVVPLKTEAQESGVGYHLRNVNYYISNHQGSGFKLHPAFYNEAGDRVDYILLGAYEGCIYDTSASEYITDDTQVTTVGEDKLSSIAGVKPVSGSTQNLTRPNVETLAQNRGSNWHGSTVKIASMNQLLCMIEMGTMNFQSAIGQGVVSYESVSGNEASNTGATSSLGNGTGQATQTTHISSDGTETIDTTSGKLSVSYRGLENPWGNIWEFEYGVNIWGNGNMAGGEPYVADDFNFAESKRTDNYEGAGFTVTNANGCISAMGYSTRCDWLFMASETAGNSSLPVGDYTYVTPNLNGYRIALLGGHWNGGDTAGGFCWYLNNGVGTGARYSGGRLVYIPQIEKQHIYTTGIDVSLPALSTLPGTNTLSVGTEVQPSHIFAEFDKEREYG